MTDEPDDDDDGLEVPHVDISFTFDFHMIRMVGNLLIPSHISVTAGVSHLDATDEDIEVAFTKIKFWIENVVSRCVAFGKDNPHASQILIDAEGNNRTRNPLMMTPDDPSDEHLAAILQAKLDALSANALVFGDVTVESSNIEGLSFTFSGNACDILPEMEEWIGTRSYFALPWWHRDDASTLDVVPPEDADLNTPPQWAFSLDFIRQTIAPTAQTPSVVLRPTFRPTVIKGGKDKDGG